MRNLVSKTQFLFIFLLTSSCLWAAIGAVYQVFERSRDLSRAPPPGNIVETKTGPTHVWCRGKGGRTLVLVSGVLAFSSTWAHYMDQLSGDFRVCTYDREGVAWSKSEGANVQLEKTVARLREIVLRLLSCQHKSRVYILAHSYGALVAYAFAKKFPDLVERIVFLDPLPIASMSELPLREMKLVKKFEQRLRILRYIQHIGAVRVSGIVEAILSSLPSDVRLAGARFAASDSHYGVALNELRDWPEIAESLASLEGSRGYVSSIVLSADPPLWVPKLQPSNSRLWRELQSRYLSQPRKVPVEVVWGIDHAGLILDKSAAKWVAQRASKFFIHRTER